MEVTNKELKMHYRGHDIVIPKGTRITHKTATGVDPNYNFIDDLSWIPLIDFNGKKLKNFSLIHDATYYGININPEDVENIG
jgi:hypothetical protein